MIVSSAFVLAALTLTGIYMRNQSAENQNDGYIIDFSALENSGNNGQEGTQNSQANEPGNTVGQADQRASLDDDLDYDPLAQVEEVDSGDIEIPGLTDRDNTDGSDSTGNEPSRTTGRTGAAGTEGMEEGHSMEEDTEEEEAEAFNDHVEVTKALNFSYSLIRPSAGEVLIPYSMDKSVYFATLDQYKYNPSVIIAATEGDPVKVCSDARVISVFSNEEIGYAVTLDLGDGYQATYGQMRDIQVSVGNYIDAGEVLGFVNAPTKYYSMEGTNVYFQLKKDDAAVDPAGFFQ